MVNYQCYVCTNVVTSETSDNIREKYFNVIGNKLYAGSHLCYICLHLLQKLWSFKTTCLNRCIDVQYGCEEELNWSLLFRLTKDSDAVHNYKSGKVEYVTLCQEPECNGEQVSIYSEHTDNEVQESCTNHNDTTANDTTPEDSVNDLNNVEITNDVTATDDDVTASDEEIDDPEMDVKDDNASNFNYSNAADDVAVNDVTEECESQVDVANADEPSVKRTKRKKVKKRSFVKIILSYEEQKSILEAQRKEKKYIEAEFKCYSCAQGFLFKDSYQSHMVRHEESNGQYSCNVCGLRFATQNVRCMHVALHSERFQCQKCGVRLKRAHRKRHMQDCWNVKNEPVSCHLCGKVFKEPPGLQQHLKRFHYSKTSNRTYSCITCGKTYTDPGALRTHTITHSDRRFPCAQCPAALATPYALQQHARAHAAAPAYCAPCAAWFGSARHLRQHLRDSLQHQRYSFPCAACARAFGSRRALAAHAASHAPPALAPPRPARPPRPPPDALVCHLCGKRYKGKSKLNRHLKEICERADPEQEFEALFNDNSACTLP